MFLVSIFLGFIVSIVMGISIWLLPSMLAALFFEWGVSRWNGARFNKDRYITILILCVAFRLLLPCPYSQRLGTQCREVIDVISGYSSL